MADVMHQGEGFDQAFIQLERGGDGARNLRHLNGVGEPGAEMIGEALGEYLRLVLQAAESASMNDAVAIALEIVTIRMRRLWIAASARGLNPHCVGGQHGGSVALRSRSAGETVPARRRETISAKQNRGLCPRRLGLVRAPGSSGAAVFLLWRASPLPRPASSEPWLRRRPRLRRESSVFHSCSERSHWVTASFRRLVF